VEPRLLYSIEARAAAAVGTAAKEVSPIHFEALRASVALATELRLASASSEQVPAWWNLEGV